MERILATVPEAQGISLAEILRHKPRLVMARHRQDFIEERVMRVEDWVLSATEARLCEFCALF
ncbi:hypothetical protein [Nitrosococcus watsonii]|uniref:Uncharacterized protein n=1 Tax=Nitrosococcus watsoni (strain C-113) TaxID=105559 RepID=D8K6U8_NITWC|nr:hypothetical protein [Nitrosococcus watsonii]ADJ28625.1 hypothetical protein Nwat_1760 [Nitrosococcus watsonii C-113]